MASHEPENEDEHISPQAEDIKTWGEGVGKEIERKNEEEAWKFWKRQLMKNSWRQIELLEKLAERQDAILQLERNAAIWRQWVSKAIVLLLFGILGKVIADFF